MTDRTDPLGAGDVPLTDNIKKESPREFFPTKSEWSAHKRRQQIIKTSTVAGTIYTVPANYDLYITSMWASVNHTLVGYAGLSSSSVGSGTIALIRANCAANNSSALSINFSMPMRIPEGGTIDYFGTGSGVAGFSGYIEDSNII